jgi:hypothetical protein
MLALASGWCENREQLYTCGGVPVYAGDLIVRDEDKFDELSLACQDLNDTKPFLGLLPVADWPGKRIQSIHQIADSDITFRNGSGYIEGGQIFVVSFTDGSIGEMIIEGSLAVSISVDENISMDLMVACGMMDAEQSKTRSAERDRFTYLNDRIKELTTQRKKLQVELSSSEDSATEARLYAAIEACEDGIKSSKAELDGTEWYWARRSFDSGYITNWLPSLVDLFGYKLSNRYAGRDTSQMLPVAGKAIKAVHVIFEPSEGDTFRSGRVYTLEFENGTFSHPFGLANGCKMSLPLSSLHDVGLLSDTSRSEVVEAVKSEKARITVEASRRAHSSALRTQLEAHGLGLKRTKDILAELATLES